jgi:hypothetical protein
MNGNATYVVGESRGREGFDLTRYCNGNSWRKNFPSSRRLESFLDEEIKKNGLTIVSAKSISGKGKKYVEKLNRNYS